MENEFLQKIWNEVHTIKKALLGDEYNEYGVIKRLADAEIEIEKLNNFKNKIIYTAVGVSISIGTAFTVINYLINNLKK